MPKFRAVLTAWVVLCLALTSCSPTAAPGTEASSPDSRPLVLTTFTVLADMARQVGGDHIRVASITKIGAEIHGYQPTPSDLKNAAQADLILDNGLGLERWFSRFVAAVDARHAVLSTGIDSIPITIGEHQGEANPHAWMSPAAGQIYVDNIVNALSDLDPEHAAAFAGNGKQYKAQLQQLLDELRSTVATMSTTAALVTCEGAFSYLARDAGLPENYLWPVNSDTEGTPRQITQLIDFIEAKNVPTVFCESTVSPHAQQQVADATGARLLTPLYVDSLSGPDGPVPSYLELLRYDISLITTGLIR